MCLDNVPVPFENLHADLKDPNGLTEGGPAYNLDFLTVSLSSTTSKVAWLLAALGLPPKWNRSHFSVVPLFVEIREAVKATKSQKARTSKFSRAMLAVKVRGNVLLVKNSQAGLVLGFKAVEQEFAEEPEKDEVSEDLEEASQQEVVEEDKTKSLSDEDMVLFRWFLQEFDADSKQLVLDEIKLASEAAEAAEKARKWKQGREKEDKKEDNKEDLPLSASEAAEDLPKQPLHGDEGDSQQPSQGPPDESQGPPDESQDTQVPPDESQDTQEPAAEAEPKAKRQKKEWNTLGHGDVDAAVERGIISIQGHPNCKTIHWQRSRRSFWVRKKNSKTPETFYIKDLGVRAFKSEEIALDAARGVEKIERVVNEVLGYLENEDEDHLAEQ